MKIGEIVYGRVNAITQENFVLDQVHLELDNKMIAIFNASELRGIYAMDQSGARAAARRYVGRRLPAMVTKVKPLEVSYSQALEKMATEVPPLQPGDVFTGIISNVQRKQAEITYKNCIFTTMPASEFGWAYSINLIDVLYIGQSIKVDVIDIKDGQIIVSHKQYAVNPWPEFAKKYRPKNFYYGRVKAVLKDDNAMIANIEPGLDIYCYSIPFGDVKPGTEITIEMTEINVNECKARGNCVGLAFAEAQ